MKVHFYGRLRDGPPVPDVPDDVGDLDSLLEWLRGLRPELSDATVRIAVNDTLVSGNCPLVATDEIFLLPPASGG